VGEGVEDRLVLLALRRALLRLGVGGGVLGQVGERGLARAELLADVALREAGVAPLRVRVRVRVRVRARDRVRARVRARVGVRVRVRTLTLTLTLALTLTLRILSSVPSSIILAAARRPRA